ncbi:MAG: hypothetical protein ABI072_05415, partial [Edaphobacter sp.]
MQRTVRDSLVERSQVKMCDPVVPGHEVTTEARREPAIGAAPVLKEEDRPRIRVQAVAEDDISFDSAAPRRHLLGDLIGN